MVLRKLVAFIGLLGVIYALALQHGVFDRAAAASSEPQIKSPEPVAATPGAVAAAPRHTSKCGKGGRQKCN